MKKLNLLFALFITVSSLLVSCSKDDGEDVGPKDQNPLIGTKWVADDEITEIVLAGDWEQGYEFLNDTECQYLKIKDGNVQDATKGTYIYSEPNVTVIVGDREDSLEISGSVMTSKIYGKPSGGSVTYTKQ